MNMNIKIVGGGEIALSGYIVLTCSIRTIIYYFMDNALSHTSRKPDAQSPTVLTRIKIKYC